MSSPVSVFQEIPLKWIGPIAFNFPFKSEVEVPLATYESALWPSVARGAKLSRLSGGIHVEVNYSGMTRSIVLEAPSLIEAGRIAREFSSLMPRWQEAVSSTSRYAKLRDVYIEGVGPLLFLRLAFDTADAAGHNMSTKAAQAVLEKMLSVWPQLSYVSLSANLCSDKKVSAVNALYGRGWQAQASIQISREICLKHLHTEPEKIQDLHVKKNLIGSTLAGSLRSANAHFANMLLAFYLATGQDGANIVEGSQGITHAQVSGGDLHFSVALPSLILGTVGHGKEGSQVAKHLQSLGCLSQSHAPGQSSKRLAMIAAGVVLCGELSLLAALTRPGELMRAHTVFERSS
jgi:hydroxymethylglutaryl-CoA reductase (NADPH)